MDENKKHLSFDFEIENTKILIALDGGFFDFEFDNSFRVHNHNSYEFHIAMQGDVAFKTEHGTYELDESDIFIIAPYVIHSCVRGVEKSVKTSFCFSFSETGEKSKNDIYTLLTKSFSKISSAKQFKASKKYVEIIERILCEFYSDAPLSQARLKAHFSLLFLEIAENLMLTESIDSTYKVPPSESDVCRAVIEEYVNRNYNSNLSLGTLSKILNLCKKQTSRVVKKEFGMTFRQLVAKTRYSAATYLLTNTNASISEIATKVGYDTYNGFYNMFLSKSGMSPEQYRSTEQE